jgi:hypothetical protein
MAETQGRPSHAAAPVGDTLTNIQGNGHTVRYKIGLAATQWLGGRTFKLAGGGTLLPE